MSSKILAKFKAEEKAFKKKQLKKKQELVHNMYKDLLPEQQEFLNKVFKVNYPKCKTKDVDNVLALMERTIKKTLKRLVLCWQTY